MEGESIEGRVDRLSELLDLERQAEIDEFDTIFSTLATKQLEKRGLCLTNLSVGEVSTGLYGKILITFEYSKIRSQSKNWSDDKTHKISNGDIV